MIQNLRHFLFRSLFSISVYFYSVLHSVGKQFFFYFVTHCMRAYGVARLLYNSASSIRRNSFRHHIWGCFSICSKNFAKSSIIRKYMIIAAYGFVLFYIAGSAMAAQAISPYGIVSVSSAGISCYLIYIDIYSSAVTVSQDAALRLSIRKSLTE